MYKALSPTLPRMSWLLWEGENLLLSYQPKHVISTGNGAQWRCESSRFQSQISLIHSQAFPNVTTALQETETNATNLCWQEGGRKVVKRIPWCWSCWEVSWLSAPQRFGCLQPWTGIQEWLQGWKELSLRHSGDVFLFPQSPQALTNSPKEYRAQNTLRLRWGVKGSLCDSGLPLCLCISVSISSLDSHILGHYFRGLYLDLFPGL